MIYGSYMMYVKLIIGDIKIIIFETMQKYISIWKHNNNILQSTVYSFPYWENNPAYTTVSNISHIASI